MILQLFQPAPRIVRGNRLRDEIESPALVAFSVRIPAIAPAQRRGAGVIGKKVIPSAGVAVLE